MNRVGVTLLVVALLAPGSIGAEPSGKPAPAKGKDAAKQKRKPKFTVGKETTRVNGPLDSDGYIDYATALNKRLSRGVTVDNNANVLLWKALGPHPEGATMTAEFFKWLGIPSPPERGDYIIPLGKYLREVVKVKTPARFNAFYEQQAYIMQRPWTPREYPEMAGWLKANEKPLALVVEATRRPEYYLPLVPRRTEKGSEGLISVLLPSVQKCRELASALSARAMLRVGRCDYDGAWQDLLACHRLGRLCGRGGTLIEGLVGIAIDSIASRADVVFLAATDPDGRRIAGYLRDLRNLPPIPSVADKVDLCERFMFLDMVLMVDRHGVKYIEALAGGGAPKANPLTDWLLSGADWDPALRNGNRWYDRLAAAMRGKDRPTREKELDRIEKELKELKVKVLETVEKKKFVGLIFGKDAARARGKFIGDVLVGLLVPAVRKVQTASDRSHQIEDNVHLAFALAWYHRDHGRYPEKLEALAPKYLPRVPQDQFAGKPLIYRPSGKGYVFYSVGANGKDDGGRGYDDKPPADDLVVRMPLPKLPAK